MATEMNFWARLQHDSPAFFVRIQNIAIYLGTLATAIWGALKLLPADTFTMPDWGTKVYSYIMVAAVVAGIIAKTPMKDPTEPPANKPEK